MLLGFADLPAEGFVCVVARLARHHCYRLRTASGRSAPTDRNNRNKSAEFGIRLKQPAAKSRAMERTRRDGSAENDKGNHNESP
ncbi:hypothetical protein LJR234_003799 [Mesorhizobium amorphae]|uniref:hypothetical protein n=1 Tax=Mesorhizobium amorphae TaxID=71433 RepID=UPI003ECD7007